jgi:hypothetical protein
MKHIIILGDGMADYAVERLGGKTLLQYANTPYMDLLAKKGRTGRLITIPDGFQPGSEVANAAILGYNLNEVYQGRGPLEAASIGYEMQPGDFVVIPGAASSRYDVAVVTGIIQSFYDAPGYSYNEAYQGETAPYKPIGKFYEEICEINVGLGIEYWYNNIFAVRAGFFNEPNLKGGRRYVTVGAALKYNVFGLDVSYLIPVGTVYGSNPLENTLRFNLTYMMGKKKS